MALGAAWGAAAGLVLGAARLGAVLANGVRAFNASRVLSLVNTAVFYVVAGTVAAYVVGLLRRAEREISAARAREEVARTLHDGVLQTLAMDEARVNALGGAVGEALTNAGKHADATRVTVFVEPTTMGGVFCTVKDDGSGFDPTAPTSGAGVQRSIMDRMRDVGGRAQIHSRPGMGTEVRLWV